MSTAEAVFLAIVGPLLAYCVYADFRDGRIAKLRMRARRRRNLPLYEARRSELMAATFEEYTCADCGVAPKCRYAFDGYNTNGDCLAEK